MKTNVHPLNILISSCITVLSICSCNKTDQADSKKLNHDTLSASISPAINNNSACIASRQQLVKRYMDNELFDTADPDTAIIVYLYLHHDAVDVEPDFEIYYRWDIEYKTLSKKYFEILCRDKNSEFAFNVINKNKDAFVASIHDYVDSFYEQHHALDSKEFTFLLERKDPLALEYLKKQKTIRWLMKRAKLMRRRNWKNGISINMIMTV